MRTIEQILKYIGLFIVVLIGTFCLNFALFIVMTVRLHNESAYFPMEKLEEQIEEGEDEEIAITRTGISLLEEYESFAMILDGEGKVIWNYKLPDELYKKYTLQEVAVFSKWYLEDYPVTCLVMGEELLVVGAKKHSIWKYSLAYTMTTMEMYIKYIPLLGLVDLCVIILLPFVLLRRHNTKREQERTTWIAGVSHDIRTPLALVMGYAEELKNVGSEDAQKIAERIDKESLKIRRLVTNLNTENKMSYGMGKWEKEKISFAAFLREELCDFINRDMDGRYDFDIVIEEAAKEFLVSGDRELLRRMIDNIINNATGHNPDGCNIMIRLGCVDRKHYVLRIADDGCGMSEVRLRDICKKNRKNVLPERGLGMRLVYRIARQHGFKVHFFTEEGKGMGCEIYMKDTR